MDAKTRDLFGLVALSGFGAGLAWSWSHPILGSIFFTLGVVAILSTGQKRWG
jgi:hypothetical protein